MNEFNIPKDHIKTCIEMFDSDEAAERITDYINGVMGSQKELFELQQIFDKLQNRITQTNENTKKNG